jgi:phospholipase C
MANGTTAADFRGIKRFVVLMLENRSFDHLFGFMKKSRPDVAGLSGSEFNQKDPNSPTNPKILVRRASTFVMPFDPAHEYYDVQVQLYGPMKNTAPDFPPIGNSSVDPAPMTGFVANAVHAVDFGGDERLVMDCFEPDQVPILSTLAEEFALFNYWYSSLPGPTWPNRFFIHAATSGGLTDSPSTGEILKGFEFQATIYDRLEDAGRSWCIYHDGLPQTAGITNLRKELLNPATERFGDMGDFFEDVRKGQLSDYNFLEPRYDTGNNYLDGNSMHPLNDIRKGEVLVKRVYEALRNSPYWADTMLLITFDEHGGFYDHQAPPAAVPPGDAGPYRNPNYSFRFDRLGVRVPAILVSAYTTNGAVIGRDPAEPLTIFDHTSALATVEKCFGLPPLTARDAAANTLEIALDSASPRLAPDEAPMKLPDPAPDSAVSGTVDLSTRFAADPHAPLSINQKTMAALALACDMELNALNTRAALVSQHQKIVEQADAAKYIESVERKISARRDIDAGQ